MSRIQIATRRGFLTQGLGLVGVGATLPNFLVRTALAEPKDRADERILVVVQFSGGHDGLSAVVPYGNDNYARGRKATRITAKEVLKINDQIGLHPNLTGVKEMLDQDAFAVVQGVGYPNPNRSHFKSMDIWHLADNAAKTNSTKKNASHGWIGKYCDQAFAGNKDAKLAIALGGGKAPVAIQGAEHPGISFNRPESFRFSGDRGDKRRVALYKKFNQMAAKKASGNLEFVTRTAVNANASSAAIREMAAGYETPIDFPKSRLSGSLRTVAGLIAGGLSTRVYYVFQGGFDTHRGQKTRHDRLMTELSTSIAAFQKDLARQGNSKRVLTMCFSEFGRRVKENASAGTDHGKAGPMFLFGPAVKAGLHGEHPSLAPADLDKGDLRFRVDFRSVYATVLEKWLNTSSQTVLGAKFPLLDVLG